KSFTDHVTTTVAALLRQLAHMAPSLRYVRERREPIAISQFLEEIGEYHAARWAAARIALALDVQVDNDLVVVMNRGKLHQVFDNLIINSEYWLREDLSAGRIRAGRI